MTFVFREYVYNSFLSHESDLLTLILSALQNSILPFSEPVIGKNGKLISEVEVPKGTPIMISIRACNRNKAIWGDDALEWKPERWLTPLPKTVTEARIPGVYSNL